MRELRFLVCTNNKTYGDMLCEHLQKNFLATVSYAEELVPIKESRKALHYVDLLILDMDNIGSGDAALVRSLRRINPGMRVLGVLLDYATHNLQLLLEATLHGMILRKADKFQINKAVRSVLHSGYYIDANLGDALARQMILRPQVRSKTPNKALKDRDLVVLEMICNDYSSEDIASTMQISKRTIEGYKARIRKVVGTNNFVSAAVRAAKMGWISV